MNETQVMREEGVNGSEKQPYEVERKSVPPRDVERAAIRQAAQKSDANDLARGEDSNPELAPEDNPAIPDTKHKHKRKNGKDRNKPNRTMDRPRLK